MSANPADSSRTTWSQPETWDEQNLILAGIAGGALLFVHLLKALQFLDPNEVDYAIFVHSVRRWWVGLPMHVQLTTPPIIDYNPPQFHLMVLPFAWLPLPVGYILWNLAGALALWWCLRIIRATSGPLSPSQNHLVVVGLLCAAGVATTLRLGQWSWILAGIVLSAWKADRSNRPWIAGAWLGLAISLKPFLLLALPVFAVRSAWRVLAAAAVSSVAALALGAAVFGQAALLEWLHLLSVSPPPLHVRHFINASVIGAVMRSDLPPALGVGAAGVVCVVTILRSARIDTDRAWLLWMTGALLASPLGWIYYQPILLGPLLAVALPGRLPAWTSRLWPAFVFPPISQVFGQWTTWSAFSIGSIYGWGLFGLWLAVLQARPLSHRGASEDM